MTKKIKQNNYRFPDEKPASWTNNDELPREVCCYSSLRCYLHVNDGIIRYLNDNGAKLYFNDDGNTVFIRTEIGFWKIHRNSRDQLLLFHLNHYNPSISSEELMKRTFHRQTDVSDDAKLSTIMRYILRHDAAKKIIADDYRNLPHRTSQEKKYYKIAEARDRRKKIRNVNKLIERLNREEKSHDHSV